MESWYVFENGGLFIEGVIEAFQSLSLSLSLFPSLDPFWCSRGILVIFGVLGVFWVFLGYFNILFLGILGVILSVLGIFGYFKGVLGEL